MKDILRKLKLADDLTTNLKISRTEFVKKLAAITDKGQTGMFSDTVDAFSSTNKKYKGEVDFDGFKLKRRRRFFDTNINMAVATGTINEHDGYLTIETEINGFNNFYMIFNVFVFVFCSILILNLVVFENNAESFPTLLLIVHGTLVFSITYFIMRRKVKQLKYELEREFFYLSKHN